MHVTMGYKGLPYYENASANHCFAMVFNVFTPPFRFPPQNCMESHRFYMAFCNKFCVFAKHTVSQRCSWFPECAFPHPQNLVFLMVSTNFKNFFRFLPRIFMAFHRFYKVFCNTFCVFAKHTVLQRFHGFPVVRSPLRKTLFS